MASSDTKKAVFDVKMTTVVPASVTGENVVHELSNMDLTMKLHYIRGLYFFKGSAVSGLSLTSLKVPMFELLDIYYKAAGRIRRSDRLGRPFIKCNDSGVRVIEAQCSMTIEECLERKDYSLHFDHLAPNQVLGPELYFSPLVLIQLTLFKCGGISVGLSWAHVLGDAFSASRFMNIWGQILAGNLPPKSQLNLLKSQTKPEKSETTISITKLPLSVKQIESVGDSWKAENNCKLQTHSFQITATELNQLQSKISNQNQADQIPPFEALCAVIWQCLAKTRSPEPRTVTICQSNSCQIKDGNLGNNQVIGVVEANVPVVEADLSDLAALISRQNLDCKSLTECSMEGDQGQLDFIVYGANLSFVNLEDVDLYGLEMKGNKPVFANYKIDGVGNEGVVLVLPGPENVEESGNRGRTVTVTLPENQVIELRNELQRKWCIE